MSSIEVKSFDNPDESNTSFNNAKMDIVKVGDQRVMRLVLQPGWKWSQDIKPTVGTDSCKAKHLGVIGASVVGILFNLWGANSLMSFEWYNHLLVGGFAFGIVFMATDPVSAAQTTKGKWIYGFLVGVFCILIRVFNPAYPEGVMLAILLMNVFAPLIDHYVIESNVSMRRKRWQGVKLNTT